MGTFDSMASHETSMHVCFLTITSSLRVANGCLLALLPSPAVPPPCPRHSPFLSPRPGNGLAGMSEWTCSIKVTVPEFRKIFLEKVHVHTCIYACLKQYSHKNYMYVIKELYIWNQKYSRLYPRHSSLVVRPVPSIFLGGGRG